MLRTEGQIRTFNQLQAYHEPLMESRPASTPVRQVSTPVQQAATQVSKDLEKGTASFQQMLLKENIPWIPVIEQASNGTMSRRPRGLNPAAAEFHIAQINKQLSNTGTSQARQGDVPARVGTLSAAIEEIKILENEVAALKLALKIQTEKCTCMKVEDKWEDELQNPKEFSDYASLSDSRQLEVVDDGASSDLIEL
jgi:hypothetical protein